MFDGFTALEVSRLAGFDTTLMLNYLERSGTFTRERCGAAHHGKWRSYTFRDLVVLRAINRLLHFGARPKRIQEALSAFALIEKLPNDADSLAEFARKSSLFVVTQSSVIFCLPDQLVNLSEKGQLAFSFMVDNHAALTPVATAVTRYLKALDAKRPRNKSTLDVILKKAGY
jgi:DNA-binding transcriptional MerR regulator